MIGRPTSGVLSFFYTKPAACAASPLRHLTLTHRDRTPPPPPPPTGGPLPPQLHLRRRRLFRLHRRPASHPEDPLGPQATGIKVNSDLWPHRRPSLLAPVRVFRMPLSKPSRGEHDAPRTSNPTGQKRLYLMFDDWELGYSIRELNLSNAGGEQRRLPPPFIRLEAMPGRPEFFAAVGTKILATHPVPKYGALAPIDILPIIDVRSRGVNLAPGELYPEHPIYIPFGDSELFALDNMLSMKPLWPPRMEIEYSDRSMEWSWHNLPVPTFERMDVTTYAVDADGGTILTSTNCATFAFDIANSKWKQSSNCPLPFSGSANFVPGLDVFVGLPKDVDYFGHLCFCRWLGDDKHDVWFSEENLSSKDPDESHVGSTLVYLGERRFCEFMQVHLSECISLATKAVR